MTRAASSVGARSLHAADGVGLDSGDRAGHRWGRHWFTHRIAGFDVLEVCAECGNGGRARQWNIKATGVCVQTIVVGEAVDPSSSALSRTAVATGACALVIVVEVADVAGGVGIDRAIKDSLLHDAK